MMFPFGPVVEPYKSAQTMIPEDPVVMCEHAWSDHLPVIFSSCSGEGLLVHKETKRRPVLIHNLVTRFHDMVPLDLGGDQRESLECVRIGAAFKKFYFGLTEPEIANLATYENVRPHTNRFNLIEFQYFQHEFSIVDDG